MPLNPALLALKSMLEVVGFLCHTKYWEHPIYPLFCSTFSSGGFTLLLFEAKEGGFSHNFPEKQGEKILKTDSAFVSDSQALLNGSCCIISKMCYHFPSLDLSRPAKARDLHLSETGRAIIVLYLWKVSLSIYPQRYSVLHCDFSCCCSEERGGCSSITQVSSEQVVFISVIHQENFFGCYSDLACEVRFFCLTSISVEVI